MLAELLREKGITNGELGRRIGRSSETVSRYATGSRPIPPEVARLISLSTGIPLSQVLFVREEATA